MSRRPSRGKQTIRLLVTVLVLGLFVFGLVLFLQAWRPRVAKLEYGLGVDQTKISEWLKDFDKKGVGDVKVVQEISLDLSEGLPANVVLEDILVPIAKFDEVTKNGVNSEDQQVRYISLLMLKPYDRLLSLDGHYFFDSYNKGAKFKLLKFSGEGAEKFAMEVKKKAPVFPSKETVFEFKQTGVTALARGMKKILRSGKSGAWVAERVAEDLKKADITHVSNEVPFGYNCPSEGGRMCAEWDFLEALKIIGTDVVELTGNHLHDFGQGALMETLNKYEELGWKTFGGGSDEVSASRPLNLNIKGSKVTLIGVNESTSLINDLEKAGVNKPGVNPFNKASLMKQIREARERGDYVVVDVQFFECYSYPDYGKEMPECDQPIAGQKGFFREIVDMGADMVVGTQAHQPQTYEIYNEKPIYYGLGNLFFDQIMWPGTTRSLVLEHYFYAGKLLQTRVRPTRYGADYQTKWMEEDEAMNFLKRLAPKMN